MGASMDRPRRSRERFTEKLKHAGRDVELRGAADVEDLTRYNGVVLGGSL
jgi:menaquinone-dependent protoporphyrinogen IX oxidase